MPATLRRGDTVTIHSPGDFRADVFPRGNPTLHGTRATVLEATDYGFLLDAPAAATGRFRATPDEVRPAGGTTAAAREQGYTGDICSHCSGMKVIRNGACLLCTECATSSGCS